jgi:hypothetical protein
VPARVFHSAPQIELDMAKKPNPKPESILYNVHYEDGSQTSNRRVPGNLLKELDSELQIQAFIEQQDREIAERSGRPRGAIKSIERVRDR